MGSSLTKYAPGNQSSFKDTFIDKVASGVANVGKEVASGIHTISTSVNDVVSETITGLNNTFEPYALANNEEFQNTAIGHVIDSAASTVSAAGNAVSAPIAQVMNTTIYGDMTVGDLLNVVGLVDMGAGLIGSGLEDAARIAINVQNRSIEDAVSSLETVHPTIKGSEYGLKDGSILRPDEKSFNGGPRPVTKHIHGGIRPPQPEVKPVEGEQDHGIDTHQPVPNDKGVQGEADHSIDAQIEEKGYPPPEPEHIPPEDAPRVVDEPVRDPIDNAVDKAVASMDNKADIYNTWLNELRDMNIPKDIRPEDSYAGEYSGGYRDPYREPPAERSVLEDTERSYIDEQPPVRTRNDTATELENPDKPPSRSKYEKTKENQEAYDKEVQENRDRANEWKAKKDAIKTREDTMEEKYQQNKSERQQKKLFKRIKREDPRYQELDQEMDRYISEQEEKYALESKKIPKTIREHVNDFAERNLLKERIKGSIQPNRNYTRLPTKDSFEQFHEDLVARDEPKIETNTTTARQPSDAAKKRIEERRQFHEEGREKITNDMNADRNVWEKEDRNISKRTFTDKELREQEERNVSALGITLTARDVLAPTLTIANQIANYYPGGSNGGGGGSGGNSGGTTGTGSGTVTVVDTVPYVTARYPSRKRGYSSDIINTQQDLIHKRRHGNNTILDDGTRIN